MQPKWKFSEIIFIQIIHVIFIPSSLVQIYCLFMTMATKKRKYCNDFIDIGFTSIMVRGVEQPQCVICMKVLAPESMKPNKMRRHLEAEHPHLKDKD